MNACTCGCDTYHFYVRCLDRRGGWFGHESESYEIKVAGAWPSTVVCDQCGKRWPTEEAVGDGEH